MAVIRYGLILTGLALALAGCSKSEEPAPAGSAPAANSPAGKTSDAATAADPSKGDRDASDMPAGGPGGK